MSNTETVQAICQWEFNANGKVVKYDHVTDTAQMIRMGKGE